MKMGENLFAVRLLHAVIRAPMAAAVLVLAVGCAPRSTPSGVSPGNAKHGSAYRIVPRDELRILVLGSPELTGSQRVSSDGNVTLSYIGEVRAEGLTETDLARAIEARLADGYLNAPQVTVTMATFGDSVYVVGEVARPGAYPFQPNLTVLQAVALAGGTTARASTGRTRVLRPATDGAVTVVPVEPGDRLSPDDVVVVPVRVF